MGFINQRITGGHHIVDDVSLYKFQVSKCSASQRRRPLNSDPTETIDGPKYQL